MIRMLCSRGGRKGKVEKHPTFGFFTCASGIALASSISYMLHGDEKVAMADSFYRNGSWVSRSEAYRIDDEDEHQAYVEKHIRDMSERQKRFQCTVLIMSGGFLILYFFGKSLGNVLMVAGNAIIGVLGNFGSMIE